jgi:hypothetical protein
MSSSSGAHAGSGSDLEPLYCAEQIKVPAALPEVLKAWTKQVIREGVPQVSTSGRARGARVRRLASEAPDLRSKRLRLRRR